MVIGGTEATGRSEGSRLLRKIENITANPASISVQTLKLILQILSVLSNMACDSTDPTEIMYIRSQFQSKPLRKLESSILP